MIVIKNMSPLNICNFAWYIKNAILLRQSNTNTPGPVVHALIPYQIYRNSWNIVAEHSLRGKLTQIKEQVILCLKRPILINSYERTLHSYIWHVMNNILVKLDLEILVTDSQI